MSGTTAADPASTTVPRSGERPAKSPAKISFRNITKEFVSQAGGPAMKAIDGLSLDIAEKDFVCLIGPSGCGKSTLLNMIAGFEQATSGDVLLDGVGITGPGADRGVVFQEGALFPPTPTPSSRKLDCRHSQNTCQPSFPAACGSASRSRAR